MPGTCIDKPSDSEVYSALDALTCYEAYPDWLKVGMALHDWDDGHKGLSAFDAWSRQAKNYCPRGCEEKWFQFTKGSTTIKTLFFLARESGWEWSGEKMTITHKNTEKKPEIDPYTLPIKALTDRGIKVETCEAFGVRVELSEKDGKTVENSYYPDTKEEVTGSVVCGWEKRGHIEKRFCGIGDRKGNLELWGTPLAKKNNAKKLFITEGRLDAMSLYQVVIDYTDPKWKSHKPSIVSVTRGAGTALKDILNNRSFVESFSEVILLMDNDEPGNKARDEILKTFPMFKVVSLPLKDANDMLMKGRGKELYEAAMWKASVKRQGQVIEVCNIIEQILVRPKMGLPWPWPKVTELTYGIRPHTIHIVGAAPKIGKSDHEYQLIHHVAYNLNQRVGIFDLENPPSKTVKKVASKFAGLDYTRPDNNYSDELLREHAMMLNERIRLYDRGASRDWSDIRIAMEEMHLLDGINIFTLDPITALISRFTSSEANDRLNEICTDIADLVHKYPITLVNYSHVNPKQKGSKPHEEGARVLSSEFTGSRAMEKWFHYGWGIRRDRSPECPLEEQNVSYLDLLFDRDFGNSGSVPLYFNKEDMSYLQMGV